MTPRPFPQAGQQRGPSGPPRPSASRRAAGRRWRAAVGLLLAVAGFAAPAVRALEWTVASDRPVIRPGQLFGDLDAKRAGAAHVIRLGDTYRMYYWGTDRRGFHRVLMATSSVDAPNDWKPLGVALERQPETEHNYFGPSFPHVVPRSGRPWLMYVCAWGKGAGGGAVENRTCVATSDDGGLTWTYAAANPCLALDQPYDRMATGSLWVLPHGEGLRMYYTAIGRYYPRPAGVESGHGDTLPEVGIAYAESKDGLHWEKPLAHLLISPRRFEAAPYEYICSKPCIVKIGDTYHLWVNTFSRAYRVRHLTSPDGQHWAWLPSGPEGEMGVGAPGAFDDGQRCYPTIVEHEGELRAWFSANGYGATGIGYATARTKDLRP
ncbi:MAG: exo-alpha-sialidase [Opitutaceae bacterium]|nr:exo-alpha-sialidase [Opitutaceae bacterium]